MSSLDEKIRYSIDLIKNSEKLALQYSNEGFYLAFSGGKDSQVIYELSKMAGVRFQAYMNLTTVDSKQLLDFIKNRYPDVIKTKSGTSMYKLICKNRSLPMRNKPYCCRLLKESNGINRVVINGIRKQESNKRKKASESKLLCIGGCDKFVISPILDWTKKDIWQFIHSKIGYWCELYDYGFERIGCIGCPNGSTHDKINQFKLFPRFKKMYLKAIQNNINYGNYKDFENANDVFNWWISGLGKKKYLELKNQMQINFNY